MVLRTTRCVYGRYHLSNQRLRSRQKKPWEVILTQHRRTFLKTAGIISAAAMTGNTIVRQAAAQNVPADGEPKELPKGMTFATLRHADGYGLALRTDHGILNVAAAAKDFNVGVPASITAVFKGQGDIPDFPNSPARLKRAPMRPAISSPKTRRSSDRL